MERSRARHRCAHASSRRTAILRGVSTVTRGPLALTVMLGLVACLLAPGAVASTPELVTAADAEDTTIEAFVTRVIDGSSLDAHVLGRRTGVGYLGAETPALNQPCGREALARNRELVGSRVLLREDPSYQIDEIGRRLYYAYTPEGLSIDEALVSEGLARAARIDAAGGTRLATLQAEAEAETRGCLWGASSVP